jgi:hypothetical protein
VRRWVRQAFRGEVTPSDLEHYFTNELNNAEREELLAMPTDQMEEALYSQYMREKFDLEEMSEDFDRERGSRDDRDRRRRDGFEEHREPPPGSPPELRGPPADSREPNRRRERRDRM